MGTCSPAPKRMASYIILVPVCEGLSAASAQIRGMQRMLFHSKTVASPLGDDVPKAAPFLEVGSQHRLRKSHLMLRTTLGTYLFAELFCIWRGFYSRPHFFHLFFSWRILNWAF